MMESVYPFPHHGIGHMIHQRQSAPPSLVPPGVVPNFVNPDTIGNRVTVASITLIVFASIFVAIRLLIKWRVLKKWSWDDALISLALLLAIARAIVSTINARYFGLGHHIWDIDPAKLVVEGDTQKNLLFIGNMLYLIAIMCTKLTILCTYLQLFGVKKRFRYFCFAVMAFVVSYCVIFFFIIAFNCNPVAKVWHTLAYSGEFTCLNDFVTVEVIGAFNIGTDLVILVMPIPLILNLHLEFTRKFGLLLIFATGILVWTTTIVREVIVAQTLQDFDQSYRTVSETIWLTVELDVGIICACLPTLAPIRNRRILLRILPESMQDYLCRSGYSGFQSSSPKPSSTPVDHQQSASDIELVDANKIDPSVDSNDMHSAQYFNEPQGILRRTDINISYPNHADGSDRV